MAKLTKLLTCVVAALALTASAATASTTIGNDLENDASNASCAGLSTCTISQQSLVASDQAAGGLTAPSNGVIVRWRLKTGSAPNSLPARLRILDGNTALRASAWEQISVLAGAYTFATRVPITAGNRLALDVDLTNAPPMALMPAIYDTAPGDGVWHYFSPMLVDGVNTSPGAEPDYIGLLLNADVEPDVDGDGYGDETQDGCPQSAATAGPCSVPSTPTVPGLPPAITALSVEGKLSRVWFSVDRATVLTLSIASTKGGRKKGSRCRAGQRKGRRCTIRRSIGRMTTEANAGANVLRFNRVFAGKRLPKGRYELTAIAVDRNSNEASAVKTVRFRISR